MPFIKEDLEELMKREELTEYKFSRQFRSFQDELGKPSRYVGGEKAVKAWLDGRAKIKIKTLEKLILFAWSRGHKDLIFYTPPNIEKEEYMLINNKYFDKLDQKLETLGYDTYS